LWWQQQYYEQERNETSIKDNYCSNPPIIINATGNNVENQLNLGKLIRDINRESNCRKENTNPTQNQLQFRVFLALVSAKLCGSLLILQFILLGCS
jgi:hypothetical protein